jgi:phage gp29-like protein
VTRCCRSRFAIWGIVSKRNAKLSLAVLGEQLTTTPKATGLGSGLADAHNEVRLELARGDANLLSSTLNATLVPWLVELNLPSAPLPTVWRIMDVPEDLNNRAARDKTIVDMGFRPTLAYILDTYGGEWEETPAAPPPAVASPIGQLPPAAGAAFAEAHAAFPDQAAIDAIGAPDWAALTAPLFRPIFVALEQGIAPQDLVAHMAEWYPRMDDTQLTELLARALFVGEVWGRVNAGRA